MRRIASFLFTIFPIIYSHNSFAAKNNIIGGRIISELFNNYNYASDNKKNEFNKTHARFELDLSVNISNNLSINSVSKLEEVSQLSESIRRNQLAQGGGDTSFENEGLFLEALTLDYDNDNYGFTAGKFTLNFGQAWNWKKYIWSHDFVSNNYEFREKLGLGIRLKAGDAKTRGRYILGFNAFTNDDKYLDNSTITKRDSGTNSSGNVGDEKGFSSFLTSLDINYDFDGGEELSYHFSYANLAVNERRVAIAPNKIDDENNFAMNVHYNYPLFDNLTTDALVEYVIINNLDGNIDRESHLLTTNLSLYIYKNWNLNFSRTKKAEFEAGTNGIDTQINEFSFGYKFSENSKLYGLYVLLGYKQDKIDNKASKSKDNTAGILVRYIKEF